MCALSALHTVPPVPPPCSPGGGCGTEWLVKVPPVTHIELFPPEFWTAAPVTAARLSANVALLILRAARGRVGAPPGAARPALVCYAPRRISAMPCAFEMAPPFCALHRLNTTSVRFIVCELASAPPSPRVVESRNCARGGAGWGWLRCCGGWWWPARALHRSKLITPAFTMIPP